MGRTGDVLLRQWVMLRELPRWPRMASTTQIHARLVGQGYDVTTRTVQRDLAELSTLFGYTSEEHGRALMWYWPRDARLLEIPTMDPATATAFTMLGDHLSGMMPPALLDSLKPYMAHGREVLARHSAHPYSRWHRKIRAISRGPELRQAKISYGVFQGVCEALLQDRAIEVEYRPRGANAPKTYELHPLGLIIKDSVYYLVAAAWKYDNYTHYALHRMTRMQLLDRPARKLRGFDLDEYLSENRDFSSQGTTLRLRALLDADVAIHLEERPLSTDQVITPQPNGWTLIEATVEDTDELRWWLLGFGTYVKVLSPKGLRSEIRNSLKKALVAYS